MNIPRPLIIVAAVVVCSCASHPHSGFVTIASVGDPELAIALVHHLESNGISAGTEGSLVYDLFVAPGTVQQATQILRQRSVQTNKYFQFR